MICSILAVVLTVLHLQNSVSGFSIPDSYSDPGPCHPRDSCAPSRKEDEDHLWGNHTCECGEHCVRHNTCCRDSPHAGTTLHVHHHRRETCQRMPPYVFDYFALVSSCSDRWQHWHHVRDMCERRERPLPLASMAPSRRSFEDPLSEVPVTSLATGVTYRNQFCATCNFDDGDVRMWDALLHHEDREDSNSFNLTKSYVLENLQYNKEIRSWGVYTNDRIFYKLRLLFKLPPVLRKKVKKCVPRMVSDCDASRDNRLRSKCLSYYSPVVIKSNLTIKKYRNVHCAMCNGVQIVNNVTCGDQVHGRKKTSFSFAHLIDINGDVKGRSQRCEARQMWDPFTKKCRSLVCALPGFVIKDGKCVKT